MEFDYENFYSSLEKVLRSWKKAEKLSKPGVKMARRTTSTQKHNVQLLLKKTSKHLQNSLQLH